jgi:hypothetical protein
METLAFYFPVVTRDGATLDMHWGTTVVPMRVTVEPSRVPTISDGERAAYAGRYRLTPTGSDTTVHETELVVTDSAGHLTARATPALWGYDATFDLVPTTRDGELRPSFYHAGKLFGTEMEAVISFPESSGRPVRSLELRVLNRVAAKGTRTN